MMDTLHTVLRTIRGETKSRPDHITVFREFLNQLERINRTGAKHVTKRGKTKSTRAAKR
jgi:hypothetical protein